MKALGRSKTVSSREISQSKREAVYNKYNGKCAYSGCDVSALTLCNCDKRHFITATKSVK